MSHLSLSLLGPFQATLDGQPIAGFRANKVRALLAYLAVEAGRPHPRGVLAALLWPERPERAARAALRNALAILRTAIGDRAASPPFLQITRETIQFDPASGCWLDVAAFRELAETATTDRPAHERLEEAIALYRGDFLQGFSLRDSPEFEDWALLLRERLQRQTLDALRRLIAHYESRGEIERACEAARRQVELAPWEEEAHRGLMHLLASNGQRAAALAQYEACRQALAEELGVEPAAETTALYEQIRAGEVELVRPPLNRERERLPGHPAFLRPQAESGRPGRSPFVDRERELANLEGRFNDALAGRGQVVFVTGEAGTGKTALISAFARLAESRHPGLIAVTGNCNAYTGAGDPYLPFREILAQLTGDVEARWASGTLSTLGARRLWRAMPWVVQALLEAGPGLIDAQGGDRIAGLVSGPTLAARAAVAAPGGAGWRTRLDRFLAARGSEGRQSALRPADLHVQATAFLQTLARRQPLLLILDDLQWADAGSIDLLFHLGRRLDGSRILIAGIYRPSDVDVGREGGRHPQRTSAFAAVVHELERQFGAISVHLDQVGDRAFVEAFLDSEPNRLGPAFRDALYEHTQGHALSVIEMLRGMQERGDLVRDEEGRWAEGASVDWAALPARVEAIIRARIDRLPAALRETLAVASVEGETFTAEVVAQVRGIQAYRAVAQLSGELDRQHRLVANEGSRPVGGDGQRVSRYRFRHILLQQHAYNRLDEAERAYLHEAVGDALEQVHAEQTGAMALHLARHYNAAGRMDKASVYHLQAGDRARGLYAYAEARGHYDRALEALARLPNTVQTRSRRVETLIARAATSLRADSPERNLARLAEAERLATELGDDEMPARDDLRLARVHFWTGFAHYMGGAYRESIRTYQQALSAARESGNVELIALCSASISQALGLQGHYGQAKPLAEQAIPLLEQMGHWSEWFRTQGHYGVVLVMMGDYAGGLAEIQRARAWAQERNAFTETVQSSFYLNAAYIQGGELSHALEASRQVTELAERFGDRLYIYVGSFHQSWAASRAGQYDAAVAHAARAEAMVQELGRPLVHAGLLAAVYTETALGAGRVREAIDLAERAVGIAQDRDAIFAEGLARRAWGQALAALEPPRWDEAEAQLAHSLRLLEEGQARLEAARTHVAWGTVCRERGDLAAARGHWEAAAAQWEASGLDHELARTRGLIESLAIKQ